MGNKKKKTGTISDHPDIRRRVTEFLQATVSRQSRHDGNRRHGLLTGGWRLVNGVGLSTSHEIRKLQQEVTVKIVRQIGPTGLDEGEIDRILWNEVVNLHRDGICDVKNNRFKEIVTKTLKAIDDGSSKRQQLFFRNPVVQRVAGSSKVSIGPVEILTNDTVRAEIERLGSGFMDWSEWASPYIWRVESVSAQSKARAQAEWYIDIACGFLAICDKISKQFDIYRVGWQMYHPTEMREPFTREFGISDGRLFENNMMHHYQIVIENSLVSWLQSPDTQAKTTILFQSETGSVGARLGVALGWMARGLQAAKLESRLLFFSTALETALVYSGEGIADQLARHGACVLFDDIPSRLELAAQLRELYVSRSRLVHDGDRLLHRIDVNSLEYLTLATLHEIWLKADLSMPVDVFGKLLKKSAFGFPMEWSREGIT
ncbi:HEPN domain-containing protein [Thalassospira lucentensis]|uniref:HEPN domain-containing protein n=1 Tax=Thalassospira lucentensis TaxID=168935 RepID=UPI002943982C|nr:HEPN domain-containing protein [Thalassospira lucentensis]WOI08924.1 HEPN domain-containing protein [Thalassospira lucentensis]